MFKKAISIVILTVFTFVTFSCQSIRTKQIKGENDLYKVRHKFFAVADTSGKWIIFGSKNPGILLDDAVVGETIDKTGKRRTVSIPVSEIVAVKVKRVSFAKTALAVFLALCIHFWATFDID